MYLSLQAGDTPLMEAASRGNVECLQLLLDKGADVNQQNKASLFHHEIVEFDQNLIRALSLMRMRNT